MLMHPARRKTLDMINGSGPATVLNVKKPGFSPNLLMHKGSNPQSLFFFTVTSTEFGYAVSGGHEDMTKADLVEKVTRLGDLTRRDGEVIVETIFDSVITALQGGDKIEIRGFGSFRIRQRNPRIGRNPKTGERVEVPAKRVPYFKPSKELRDLVNPEEAAKAQ
jgi:integration host factor subunit beta